MKTQLQLSIDVELKQRLKSLKQRSWSAIAKAIHERLQEHLPELEGRYPPQASGRATNPGKEVRWGTNHGEEISHSCNCISLSITGRNYGKYS